MLSYPDFAYDLAPAFKDISANSGSNVMSDLYLLLVVIGRAHSLGIARPNRLFSQFLSVCGTG